MKLDRTSMLYGTLILTGTSIVSQFLGFVYRILLSRLIGAEVMGLYQLIMPVFSVIMALTAVGLTVAVSNLSSQYHARGNRAAIARCSAAAWRCFSSSLRRWLRWWSCSTTPSRSICWGTPHPAGPAAPAALHPAHRGGEPAQALLLRHGQHPSAGGGGAV